MTLKRKRYYQNPNHRPMKVLEMDFSISKHNKYALALFHNTTSK